MCRVWLGRHDELGREAGSHRASLEIRSMTRRDFSAHSHKKNRSGWRMEAVGLLVALISVLLVLALALGRPWAAW